MISHRLWDIDWNRF